jgi:hypothetical protein
MKRRRFLFWVGLGLFELGEVLRVDRLDRLAAAVMESTEPAAAPAPAVHWRAASNDAWQWYERETLVDGRWTLTGVTTPINRESGKPYDGQKGYLDESVVPSELRVWDHPGAEFDDDVEGAETGDHLPDPRRRARHGRPPSRWLRSLNAEELRVWLPTTDVPEAGVEGMSYWEHLTRDHYFNPSKIEGLTEDEQAKLHAVAHWGY